MSEKIRPQHLSRKAILYVRQSSPYQVIHKESETAVRDGRASASTRMPEIEVVDEDLGRSAAGIVTRAAFERMVAEVCLGKVGAVAAREVSRFARNSREWQQLVEGCRVVDTVLIDQEMVYAPRLSNDWLLLGLEGSLGCGPAVGRAPVPQGARLSGDSRAANCAGQRGFKEDSCRGSEGCVTYDGRGSLTFNGVPGNLCSSRS